MAFTCRAITDGASGPRQLRGKHRDSGPAPLATIEGLDAAMPRRSLKGET